ncbi:protein phosphatase 1 regulatory subunit 3C-B-like [Protopterus annectens]|uniref:protein phosphatase 1 regulatory subunit 3C-B-like n=1 Tax=Protopterus annectens TaxID=7888 RepID=UPI001CF952D8|nr:protein phosphatase 1 regulatory subunit 3C-B-like [Protopterus annectens]
MNCTGFYPVFGSRSLSTSVMPVDFAMSLCLSCSPPIRNFLQSYEDLREVGFSTLKPLRSCLNQKSTDITDAEWDSERSPVKKKVVFADSKGLALTAVRFFSSKSDDDLSDFPLSLCDLGLPKPKLKDPKLERKNFVLDFSQPSADYMDFRKRLQSDLVCLENCVVQDRVLTGTVKVMNISFEKLVQIRITFDSWKSYLDTDCSYMHNTYGSSDVDTFSFEVRIPEALEPTGNVEFCIRYKCGKEHWDNNHGKNYRILCTEKQPPKVQPPKGGHSLSPEAPSYISKSRIPGVNEERFGRSLSSGLFSNWPNWGGKERTRIYW